jgi:hypothetical protein
MSAGRHQVRHRRPGLLARHQALAHQHRMRTGSGQLDDVARATHPRLRHRDDAVRYQRSQPAEGVHVDPKRCKVASVDPDQPGARIDRALDLVRGVALDERREPDGLGPLHQAHQGVLFERDDDEQGKVGAAGPRLPQLVAGENEVLA